MTNDTIISAGGAPPRTDTAASDAAEVLTIHETWFASAVGLDVERMRPNYVSGPHMRMSNTGGHTYIGVEELVRSWEAWHGTVDVHACEDVSEPVEVAGDIAWLVVDQAEMRCRALSPEGHGAAGRHTRGGHVPTSNPAPPPVGTRISSRAVPGRRCRRTRHECPKSSSSCSAGLGSRSRIAGWTS